MMLTEKWRATFWQSVRQSHWAEPLREAAAQERLKEWTSVLTQLVVASCRQQGWQAAAKGHRLSLLPVGREEYLSLDIVAFADDQMDKRWQYPSAIFELENRREFDYIAYALWKTLCVRADLRVVFCYRRQPNEGAALVRNLCEEVVHALPLSEREALRGQTVVVVGSRAEASTFPYGFFRWWQLETTTSEFHLI